MFRKHKLPRKAELQKDHVSEVEMYTIKQDIDGKDKLKSLDDVVQESIVEKITGGNVKVENFVLEVLPFRNSRNENFGLCQLGDMMYNINARFGNKIDDQSVFRALVDKMFEMTQFYFRV